MINDALQVCTADSRADAALQLAIAIDDTPSKRLADLMRADLQDILNEHLR